MGKSVAVKAASVSSRLLFCSPTNTDSNTNNIPIDGKKAGHVKQHLFVKIVPQIKGDIKKKIGAVICLAKNEKFQYHNSRLRWLVGWCIPSHRRAKMPPYFC